MVAVFMSTTMNPIDQDVKMSYPQHFNNLWITRGKLVLFGRYPSAPMIHATAPFDLTAMIHAWTQLPE